MFVLKTGYLMSYNLSSLLSVLYLLSKNNRAEFVPKHLPQHGHQFFMVQVLDTIKVVKVQKNHLSGMS